MVVCTEDQMMAETGTRSDPVSRDPQNHEQIWLEPLCQEESSEGRLWCWEDVWGKCDDCGAPTVRYVRADLAEKRIERAEDALRVCRRAILEDGYTAIVDTVWVPMDVSPNETLVDFIDAHLQRASPNLATRTLSTPSLETTHSVPENTEGK